ncbi:MAG: hypothetical protein WDN27_04435 [Candidatus Saccharibacteria bacterium]
MIKQHGEGFVQDYLANMGDTVLNVMQAAHEQADVNPAVSERVLAEAGTATEPSSKPVVTVNSQGPSTSAVRAQRVLPLVAEGPVGGSARIGAELSVAAEAISEIPLPAPSRIDTPAAEIVQLTDTYNQERATVFSEAMIEPTVRAALAEPEPEILARLIDANELMRAGPAGTEIHTLSIQTPTVTVVEKPADGEASVSTPVAREADSAIEASDMVPELAVPEAPRSAAELLMEFEAVDIESDASVLLASDEVDEGSFISGITDIAPESSEPERRSRQVFSERLELLAETVVAPERLELVRDMIAEVYRLAAAGSSEDIAGTLSGEEMDVDDYMVASPVALAESPTGELEQAVIELLWELDGSAPAPEQIERFIALVRAEARERAPRAAAEAVPEVDGHELPGKHTRLMWWRHELFLRLHQSLGHMALAERSAAGYHAAGDARRVMFG